jgi:hypothetical protein
MFRTGAQMSLLVLLTGLLFLRESQWRPVAELEAGGIDALALLDRAANERLVAHGWRQAPRNLPVNLIAIDSNSLNGHPWPWSPLDFSLFLQAAMPYKPEVVAIEETLDWDKVPLAAAERQKLPQYGRILQDALLRSSKVLLGQRLGWPEDPAAEPKLQEAPLIHHVTGSLLEVPEWTVITDQPKEEYRANAALGFTNLPTDRTALHDVPLVLRYHGQIVPSFVLQAVLLWQRLSLDDVQVTLGSELVAGKLHIPIDARGRMRVNFGAPRTRFGFDELLLANEQVAAKQKPVIPVSRLDGSIVLLGRTDPASEVYPVGLDRKVSSGEMFASAIATVQSGAWLSRVPWWFDGALIALAVLLGFWIPRWRKGRVALWGFVALLLYALAGALVFDFMHLWLPLVLPAGLILFIILYRASTPNYVWKLRRPVIL